MIPIERRISDDTRLINLIVGDLKELLKQWNNAGLGNQKEMKHYFGNKSTGEFINSLILEENLHGKNSAYVDCS